MDLVSLANVPKLSCSFQTGKAKASFGSHSPSLPKVAPRRPSFMYGAQKITGLVRPAGCVRQQKGKAITVVAGSYLVATAFPEDEDYSDSEDEHPARYSSYFESQILNLRTIRNIVRSVIAYYIGKDMRVVRRRVLVRDLPLDPITQVAIEVNIERNLEFLLGPIRVLPVQMPQDSNATIGDFIEDIYEKLHSSISLNNEMFLAPSRMPVKPTFVAEHEKQ